MAGPSVHIEASRTDRSLVAKAPAKRRIIVDPQLLFWRRLIDHAVADSKRTEAGIPTHGAIMSRFWLEEFRPAESDREMWATSFACACSWLSLDATAERKRLLDEIDAALLDQWKAHVRATVYQLRAAVLTCAGIVTAIGKQYVLPLVAESDYEHIAGIDRPDPAAVTLQLKQLTAA